MKYVAVTALLMFGSTAPTLADAVIGVSTGTSTYGYEYSYPYQDYNGNQDTSSYNEDIDFAYQDTSLTFQNDNGSSWTIKFGGLQEETAYSAYYDESSAKRDEYSLTFTSPSSNGYAWFAGYYASEAELSQTENYDGIYADYEFRYKTDIETSGVFFGISVNDYLNDFSFWYLRGALQLNWTTFSDVYSWESSLGGSGGSPFSKDLTGVAALFGGGIYVPVTDDIGVNFGVESKSYSYDNELEAVYEEATTLSETQTSLVIGLMLSF